MKILIVTQYFWPEDFRVNDLCAELVRRGHEITVLTGKPNYPDGVVYADFKKNPSRYTQYEGSRVIRVPMVPRGRGSSLQLLINYLTFAISASLWGWLRLRKVDIEVIFVYQPSPITVGLPAILLKKIRKVPVVFWVLDLWPETLEAIGVIKSRLVLSLVGKLVSYIYKRCDLVLGQSKAFLEGIARYCNEPQKIKYFPSWSEDIFASDNKPVVGDTGDCEDSFKVLFAGNVGEAQDFPAIIETAQVLKTRLAKVRLIVVGDGRLLSWVRQQVENRALQDYIFLLGRHPLEQMPAYYASADALLVSLKQSQIFAMTIPGKLQSYLMSGKPILGMLDGEGARVIKEANAGLSCSSGDYSALAENILRMAGLNKMELQRLGFNAKKYAQNEFDRSGLISQLEHWFSALVDRQMSKRGLL